LKRSKWGGSIEWAETEREVPVAELLVFEFKGVDKAMYGQVNEAVGIDPVTLEGDWPEGLQMHAGAIDDKGDFVVFEVWDSQAKQEAFMTSRLGPALAKVGVPEPARVQWFGVLGTHTS
jgi:hypothetical protein